MVLVPMLYTDVSDAWRLPSRRKRLGIDAAGLVVELVIGCFALFLWAFLPPGGAKSLAFALATTSLMMSLMMNLNPFMRFDGYYILADALGIENLQSRAFDIGVWRMREILFDLRLPPPESMSRRYLATLSIYAWAVWIYRLILFTAIAILVYGIGYKLLGVFLFVTEIVFFIARPIINEIKVWFTIREQIMKRRRGLWVAGTAAVAFALAFLPLSTRIAVPALLDDRDSLQIHPKRAAMVAMVHATPGQWLIAGEKLVSLVAPELDHELLQTEWRFEVATWRLQRRAASASERAETMVLEGTLESLQERLTGLRQERAELDVMMPFAGRVAEMGDALHSGRWLSPRDLIAAVVGNSGCRLVGYVDEDKVGRLEPSGSARFIPEDGRRGAIAATLQTIAAAGSDSLDLPELVSHYGGGVSARVVSRGAEGRSLVPIVGQFRVEARINDPAVCAGGRVERGTLHLVGRAESTIAGVWRQVLKVLVRESSL